MATVRPPPAESPAIAVRARRDAPGADHQVEGGGGVVEGGGERVLGARRYSSTRAQVPAAMARRAASAPWLVADPRV